MLYFLALVPSWADFVRLLLINKDVLLESVGNFSLLTLLPLVVHLPLVSIYGSLSCWVSFIGSAFPAPPW